MWATITIAKMTNIPVNFYIHFTPVYLLMDETILYIGFLKWHFIFHSFAFFHPLSYLGPPILFSSFHDIGFSYPFWVSWSFKVIFPNGFVAFFCSFFLSMVNILELAYSIFRLHFFQSYIKWFRAHWISPCPTPRFMGIGLVVCGVFITIWALL